MDCLKEHTYSSVSTLTVGQHDASQIWVKTSSGEQTILSALSKTTMLSAPSSATASYSGSVPNPGHTAMEVILSSGQSLQTSIDVGTLAGCIPGSTQKCGTDTACSTYPTLTCTSSGTWPTCTPNYIARHTVCSSDQTKACDGAGNCQGWSGTECSNNNPNSCPYGSWANSPFNDYCKLPDGLGRDGSLDTSNANTYFFKDDRNSFWYNSSSMGPARCYAYGCCWWQLICITPRCNSDIGWQIRP